MKPSKISRIKKKIVQDIVNIFEQNIELKDLVGEHKLSGVDFNNEQIKSEWSNEYALSQVVRFTLDGKTYIAAEDGFRGCMRWLRLSKKAPIDFKPIKVLARMSDRPNSTILQFLNIDNGKVILEVGTDNIDDYYPSWIASFNVENLK